MTPKEREQMLELCRRVRDEKDDKKVVILVQELNRYLDSKMTLEPPVRSIWKSKDAA